MKSIFAFFVGLLSIFNHGANTLPVVQNATSTTPVVQVNLNPNAQSVGLITQNVKENSGKPKTINDCIGSVASTNHLLDISGWQIYTNTTDSYSIKIPQGWYVEKNTVADEELAKTEAEDPGFKFPKTIDFPWVIYNRQSAHGPNGFEPFESGDVVIYINNLTESATGTIDDMAQSFTERKLKGGWPHIVNEGKVFIDGYDARKIVEECGEYDDYAFFVQLDSKLLRFDIETENPTSDQIDIINTILSTIKFTN